MVKREPIFAITELFGSWHFRKFRFCLNEELTNNFTAPILHFEVESSNNYKTLKTEEQLETNIRQRGNVGGSAKKVGLRIKELERIYGVRDGSNNPHGINVGEKNSFTQSDIAQKLGMDVRTLQNYKLLADMIPELEELLDTGILL